MSKNTGGLYQCWAITWFDQLEPTVLVPVKPGNHPTLVKTEPELGLIFGTRFKTTRSGSSSL